MTLSLSCLVTLSYSLSHSISCAGFHKFVVRNDVISPAGARNFVYKKGGGGGNNRSCAFLFTLDNKKYAKKNPPFFVEGEEAEGGLY